jgi:hypothetical protein
MIESHFVIPIKNLTHSLSPPKRRQGRSEVAGMQCKKSLRIAPPVLLTILCLTMLCGCGGYKLYSLDDFRLGKSKPPPVEVNLDVLNRLPQRASNLSAPMTAPDIIASDITSYEPPPMFDSSLSSEMPSAPVDEVTPDDLPLPAPPRRPKIMKAPDSFIARARSDMKKIDAISKPMHQPMPAKKSSGVSPKIDYAQVKPKIFAPTDPGMGGDLAQPTTAEILAVIEKTERRAGQKTTPKPKAAIPQNRGTRTILPFFKGQLELSIDMKRSLIMGVFNTLASDPQARVQIQGFSTPMKNSSETNRLAFARSQEIKKFLTSQGIDARKIDLKLPDNNNLTANTDRVDIYVLRSIKN